MLFRSSTSVLSKRKGGSPSASERSAKKVRSDSPAPEGAGAAAGGAAEPGEVNSPEKLDQAATGDAAREGERVAAAEAAVVEERVAADAATGTEGTGTSAGVPVAAADEAASLGIVSLTQSPTVEDLTQLTPRAEARSPFKVSRSLGAFGLPATGFDEMLRKLSAFHQVKFTLA